MHNGLVETKDKTYETATHVYFWGSVFSNWAKCKFTFEGVEYSSTEQAMMAAKATMFGDLRAHVSIMSTRDPKEQKAFGRAVVGFEQERWLKEGYPIVVEAIYAKFSQNKSMKDFLLATGNKTIVESAPNDTVWGVGLHATDPLILNESNWKGTNLLGKALMTVRERLRADDSKVFE